MKNSHARSIPLRASVLVFLLGVLMLTKFSPPAFAQLSDSNFVNADWFTTIIPVFSAPSATLTIPGITCQVGQDTNIGKPAASRQACTYYPFPSPQSIPPSIWVAHLYQPATSFYNPSAQGAIAGVYFSYDLSPPSQSVNYGLLIFQNGRFYKSNWTDTPAVKNPSSLWKSISHGSPSALLTAADFQEVSNSGSTQVPNFSCTGSTMIFGYVTGTSSGNHWSKSNLDNWRLDIVPGDPCCLKVLNETVVNTSGGYLYTVQLQNPTGVQIQQVTVIPTSPVGVAVTPQVTPVTFQANGQATIQLKITGALPGSTVLLRLGPFDGGPLCCSVQRQFNVP